MAYRIHSISKLTGVPATTLRAWERRYQVVSPDRTDSGYRLYSDEDLSTLLRVKTLLAQGLKAGEAVLRVQSEGDRPEGVELDAVRTELLAALVGFDLSAARSVGQRLENVAPRVVIKRVYMPLMREVGERWACGEVTISQEHLVTMFVRRRLLALLTAAETPSPAQHEAVLVGAPGEAHELGLLSVAVHLAALGMRVAYLGLDVPLNDLEQVLQQRRPALVCASVVRAVPPADCLRFARDLRRAAPVQTRVVLGGSGVPAEARGPAGRRADLVETVEDLLALIE